jgi:hypothetical protein
MMTLLLNLLVPRRRRTRRVLATIAFYGATG